MPVSQFWKMTSSIKEKKDAEQQWCKHTALLGTIGDIEESRHFAVIDDLSTTAYPLYRRERAMILTNFSGSQSS